MGTRSFTCKFKTCIFSLSKTINNTNSPALRTGAAMKQAAEVGRREVYPHQIYQPAWKDDRLYSTNQSLVT